MMFRESTYSLRIRIGALPYLMHTCTFARCLTYILSPSLSDTRRTSHSHQRKPCFFRLSCFTADREGQKRKRQQDTVFHRDRALSMPGRDESAKLLTCVHISDSIPSIQHHCIPSTQQSVRTFDIRYQTKPLAR